MTDVEPESGLPEFTTGDDTGISLLVDGELATITLDRPDRLNCQTPLTWNALRAIGSALPGTVRVVLVRGAGRAFSAGLDRAMFNPSPPGDACAPFPSVAELAHLSPDDAGAIIAGYQAAFGWLSRPDIVSIAAVQGHAVGAGFQLALACDLRVLSEDAILTMAEVRLGLVPDLGGTRRLVELAGYSRAMDICVTARPIPADEAMRMGLATAVVPTAELADASARLAGEVLARPREAVIEAKALLAAASATSTDGQETAERAAQHRLLRRLAGLAP